MLDIPSTAGQRRGWCKLTCMAAGSRWSLEAELWDCVRLIWPLSKGNREAANHHRGSRGKSQHPPGVHRTEELHLNLISSQKMRKDPARRSDMHLRGDWTPLQNLSSLHIFTFLDTISQCHLKEDTSNAVHSSKVFRVYAGPPSVFSRSSAALSDCVMPSESI